MAETVQSADLTGIGTVLLVEDEDAVRLFGARALRNKGYNVLEARSGEAALEIIERQPQGPGRPHHHRRGDAAHGRPDADQGSAARSSRAMKVIFISGYAEDAFRQRLDMDADIHFLPKPFIAQAARRQGEGSTAGRQRLGFTRADPRQ